MNRENVKPKIVPMLVFPQNRKTSGENAGFRKFAEAGLSVSVVANPGVSGYRISHSLRDKLSNFGLLQTYETEEHYHDEHLTFDLQYGDFQIELRLTAWLEKGEQIGSDLPDGIEVEIGAEIIYKIRLHMRDRAFLNPSAGGFRPVFQGRDFAVDLKSCFVLMPFHEPWSDRIWSRHIKPTVESVGLKCTRADDLCLPDVIIEDIWRAINQANVIIADLTGRNPNVFYELGIAHVIGIPAILLSQDHEIPAFDTAHWRQIRYQDNSEGCEKLENQLKATLISIQQRLNFPPT
jgi:hypothetical protein